MSEKLPYMSGIVDFLTWVALARKYEHSHAKCDHQGLTWEPDKFISSNPVRILRIKMHLRYAANSKVLVLTTWACWVESRSSPSINTRLLDPQLYLAHIGKVCTDVIDLRHPPQDAYRVTAGQNIQALLEGYDQFARLTGHMTLFTPD